MTMEPAESSHKWVAFKEADQLNILYDFARGRCFAREWNYLLVFRRAIDSRDRSSSISSRVMLSYLLNVLIYKI